MLKSGQLQLFPNSVLHIDSEHITSYPSDSTSSHPPTNVAPIIDTTGTQDVTIDTTPISTVDLVPSPTQPTPMDPIDDGELKDPPDQSPNLNECRSMFVHSILRLLLLMLVYILCLTTSHMLAYLLLINPSCLL